MNGAEIAAAKPTRWPLREGMMAKPEMGAAALVLASDEFVAKAGTQSPAWLRGMGWATALLSDLISHWEKRNSTTIHDLDPAHLDLQEVERLIRENGPESMTGRMDRVMEYFRVSQWRPNELDFAVRFDPRSRAHFVVANPDTQ